MEMIVTGALLLFVILSFIALAGIYRILEEIRLLLGMIIKQFERFDKPHAPLSND